MPSKITEKTKEFLLRVSLPEKTNTYTPISHEFAIEHIQNNLLDNKFIIKEEMYRSTENGNVANGVFELNHKNDDDMQMICCFSNSYDKSTRFSVAVGAKVLSTGNYFLSDISWIRKHSGKADKEAEKVIQDQIKHAEEYFSKLQMIKNAMQKEICNKERFGSMIGQLFVNEFITVDQISECYKQWRAMELKDEDTDNVDLWTAYQYILSALKSSHPSKWINNEIMTNMYVCNMFHIKAYMPKEVMQLDLEDRDTIAVPDLSCSFVMPHQLSEEDTKEQEESIEVSDDVKETNETIQEEKEDEIEEVTTQEEITEEEFIPDESEEETFDFEEIRYDDIPSYDTEDTIEKETEDFIDDNIETSCIVEDYDIIDKVSEVLDSMGINGSFTLYDEGDVFKIITEDTEMFLQKDIING